MKSILKRFQIFLLICGVFGAEADEVKTVMEGDSVTLSSDLTQIQEINLIQWRFGDPVIAQTLGDEISYPHLTEIFGGRLQLDLTGSLTIKNTRIKHTGLYKLQMSHKTQGTLLRTFNVTVSASPSVIGVDKAEMKSVSLMEGDPVTLQTDVTETHGDELILWRFGDEGKLIAKLDIETKSSTDETDERFRDRLKLDQTGSLTITHTRTEDSGLYRVKISSSSKQTIFKRFILTVSVPDKPAPGSGLSSGAVAGIVFLLLVVSSFATAAGVIFYHRKISELEKLKDGVKSVSVKEGRSATLNTDVTEVQTDDQIEWRFGNEGTLIAEIKQGIIKIYDDVLGGRFRGRLKLDKKTGSLIIKNPPTDDSGLYELKISRDSEIKYKKFRFSVYVSVSVSVEDGGSVTLPTGAPEVKTDDQIEWRFGNEGTLIAEIKGGISKIYEDVLNEIFRGRLKLDKKTGSLTITNTEMKHAGVYELKIKSGSGVSDKIITVNLRERKICVRGEGSVTLNPETEIQKDDQILWMCGENLIAQIKGGKRETFDKVAGGRFRGRLKLDVKTGSLTITDMRYEESGHYKLQIINSSRGNTDKIFFVKVLGRKIPLKEGKPVTLNPDTAIQRDDQILWTFRDNLIAQIKEGKRETFDDVLGGRFRGRLKLDEKTGSLTITNMIREESGLYKLHIISSRGNTDRRFCVNVSAREIPVEEGKPLTLNPETEIQKDDQILWTFRDNLIAQIKGGKRETFDDVLGGRFRGRLKLDEETGSLTITDMRDGESGLYKLQIINSRGNKDRRFIVTVTERKISVEEGEPVTLNTETDVQKDDQILWMFGGNLIAQIKGGTGETSDDVSEVGLRGRLKLDEKTGSLTITDMSDEESGHYKLQIISSSRGNKDRRFCVTVTGRKISVKEGEPVTLNTDTAIQRDDQILWMFRGKLIAQIKGGKRETFDDVLGGRFKDRLKLDEETGDLTITNMKNRKSGHYKLQIISSRGNTNRRFCVTVSNSTEPSVKESVNVVKPQSNEEIRDGERESVTVVMPLLNDVDERQETSSL